MLRTTPIHNVRERPKTRLSVFRLVDEYGPFLPYTFLYGLPADLPDDYPLWSNLLSPLLHLEIRL